MSYIDYDYSKLRGRIVEKYGTASAFADALHTHKAQLSAKLNNKVDITRADIEAWSSLLDIGSDEYGAYFFAQKVQ